VYRALGRPIPLGACALLLAACGGSSKHSSSSASPPAASPTSSAAAPGDTTEAPGATTAAPASTATSGGAPAISGNSVTASAGGVTASLVTGTHTPKANTTWPLRFTVRRGGRPAQASVSYEYLFSGQVVARRSHYTFRGSFHDTFVWPMSAIGYPLTFRAVVVAGSTTIDLDYPVQVSG